MAKIGHADQGFTVTISLAGPVDTGKVKTFRFEPSQLFYRNYCRLRGVCAFVESEDPANVYQVVIRPPRRALISVDDHWSPPVDQRDVGACVLGRVESRRSPREPEFGGQTSLLNASPIGVEGKDGEWEVTVTSLAGKIRDVQLEIRCVAQPS